jgi:hypothetical protein
MQYSIKEESRKLEGCVPIKWHYMHFYHVHYVNSKWYIRLGGWLEKRTICRQKSLSYKQSWNRNLETVLHCATLAYLFVSGVYLEWAAESSCCMLFLKEGYKCLMCLGKPISFDSISNTTQSCYTFYWFASKFISLNVSPMNTVADLDSFTLASFCFFIGSDILNLNKIIFFKTH